MAVNKNKSITPSQTKTMPLKETGNESIKIIKIFFLLIKNLIVQIKVSK
tara:strand:- start:728 stop:874 length:147 start_codon:yes stop_codon:yes gene_type:complete